MVCSGNKIASRASADQDLQVSQLGPGHHL